MKFALHNTSFLPTTGNPKDVWVELRDRAQWMDSNGFDYISVMDHLWQIPGIGSFDEPFLEAWTTLSALAAVTEHLRLVTLVTGVGYRNPALLAKMITTVDLISGGRAILGIGAGWYEAEFDAYGYGATQVFPGPTLRLAQLREAVQMIKLMWDRPRSTYDGEHFALRDAVLEPKPLQSPRPRILIGGGGEKLTLKIVAQEADMCNFIVPGPEAFSAKLEVLRGHCRYVGREVEEIETTILERMTLAPSTAKVEEKWHRSGASARGSYRGLIGTPNEVIKQVRAYEETGVQALFLSIPTTDTESRELLAREVIPAFK